MAEQRKPGEKVQTSGIFRVVKEGDGGSGLEVTWAPAAAACHWPCWPALREGHVL
jgi:hypothetical protein